MAEEIITLVSKEYATHEFTDKGEFTILEGRVNVAEGGIESLGKDAHNTTQRVSTLEGGLDSVKNRVSTVESGKQDNLTPDATIKIDAACNISVNTATSVEDSNLPVTASAVNTKLGDYVNDIEAEDDSITVTKTGSKVTLKANGAGDSDDIGGVIYYGYTNGSLNEGRLKQFLENVVAPSVNTEYGGFNIYLLIEDYGTRCLSYSDGAYDYTDFPSFPDTQVSAKIVLGYGGTMSKKKVLENFSTFDFMSETIELIPAANIFYNNY